MRLDVNHRDDASGPDDDRCRDSSGRVEVVGGDQVDVSNRWAVYRLHQHQREESLTLESSTGRSEVGSPGRTARVVRVEARVLDSGMDSYPETTCSDMVTRVPRS